MLPRVLGVAVADAGVTTEAGLAEAHAVARLATLDPFHVSGDFADDATEGVTHELFDRKGNLNRRNPVAKILAEHRPDVMSRAATWSKENGLPISMRMRLSVPPHVAEAAASYVALAGGGHAVAQPHDALEQRALARVRLQRGAAQGCRVIRAVWRQHALQRRVQRALRVRGCHGRLRLRLAICRARQRRAQQQGTRQPVPGPAQTAARHPARQFPDYDANGQVRRGRVLASA